MLICLLISRFFELFSRIGEFLRGYFIILCLRILYYYVKRPWGGLERGFLQAPLVMVITRAAPGSFF